MREKGYDHPLHSLEFIATGAAPPDDERYAIPVPGGRLMVQPALRRRAAGIPGATCEKAVAIGLAHHALDVTGFAARGLTAAWAGNLLYWIEHMREQEDLRMRLETEARFAGKRRQAQLGEGRRLWSRLLCAQRLGSCTGRFVQGEAPHGELALIDALVMVQQRVGEVVALLSDFGCGPSWRQDLEEVVPQLQPMRHAVAAAQRRRQEVSDRLTVIRGALIGDLSRLALVAPHVLQPMASRHVQMARLFPRRRRTAQGLPPADP